MRGEVKYVKFEVYFLKSKIIQANKCPRLPYFTLLEINSRIDGEIGVENSIVSKNIVAQVRPQIGVQTIDILYLFFIFSLLSYHYYPIIVNMIKKMKV